MESIAPKRQGRSPWLWPVLFLILLTVIWLVAPRAFIDHVLKAPSLAVRNLRALSWALKDYHSTHNSYPDAWDMDMSQHLERIRHQLDEFVHRPPDFVFDLDIQSSAKPIEEYLYRYMPRPAGCVEPHCTGYTLTAIPTPQLSRTYKKDALRSFVTDEAGIIRHCVGDTGANATDPTLDEAPVAC